MSTWVGVGDWTLNSNRAARPTHVGLLQWSNRRTAAFHSSFPEVGVFLPQHNETVDLPLHRTEVAAAAGEKNKTTTLTKNKKQN